MTSDDPRKAFLKALSRELPGPPLKRRRVVRELAAHFDDAVTEFRALGLSGDAAVEQAVRRLGEPASIAAAFTATEVRRRAWSRGRALRSPAWVAVGAMSLVTAWAAELPQSSGAKPPAICAPTPRHLNASVLPSRRHGGRPRRGARMPASRCGR